MKKRILAIVCCAVMLLLAGCGSKTTEPEQGQENGENTNTVENFKPQKIVISHNSASSNPEPTALAWFAEELEKRTDGNITCETFFDGVLGSETETMDQMTEGTIQISIFGTSLMDKYAPEYAVFSVPYLFGDLDHIKACWDGPIGEAIYEKLAENNIMVTGYVYKGNRQLTCNRAVQTPDDLKGMKIAAQAGTFHADALNQIENVQGSTYPEFADLLTALKSGAIDGYIAEEPTAFSVCQSDDSLTFLPFKNNETGFTATASDVGIAIGLKKGSELREQINAVLAEITPEQRNALMEQIVTLSSGGEVTEFAVSAEEPENPTGTLRVGMECAYEPYNWTDISGASFGAVPISGEGKDGLYANGYDVQIAKYVAARLGMNLEIYSIEWDSLLPALESGAIDAVAAGMSPTAERAAQIDFTDTYYESNLVVIIRK